MTIHTLKTWPAPFAALLSGEKRHEVRKDDRGFAVGDVLELREWHPVQTLADGTEHRMHGYTGRSLRVRVTYISAGGTWGLPDGLCVMSVERAPEPPPPRQPRNDRSELPCRTCGEHHLLDAFQPKDFVIADGRRAQVMSWSQYNCPVYVRVQFVDEKTEHGDPVRKCFAPCQLQHVTGAP